MIKKFFPPSRIRKHAKDIHAMLVGLALLGIAGGIEYLDQVTDVFVNKPDTIIAALILTLASRGIGLVLRQFADSDDPDISMKNKPSRRTKF